MDENEVRTRVRALIASEISGCTTAFAEATNRTIRSEVVRVYRRMDEELSGSGGKVDCGPGCDYCCYYHVMVTGAEVLALADYINALPIERRKRLTDRVNSTAMHVAPLSSAEYIRTNIQCALLENGRCAAYEIRPSACRGFHSSNVKGCKAAFDHPTLSHPHALDPGRQVASIGYKEVFLIAQHNAGCDATTYEMHTSLAEALNNSSSFKRWRRGKTAFPKVRDRLTINERIGTS
ncbi:Flagellin N-methylase [Caballeronia cordobensis]|uniref:Flagellin N-methylase n=1 Tax=Caballeronia cordobensis TaxID=1353886 RepID=A0A158JCM2_CABCO|nr:YkgJ family cysteine cluster protein [Caballeronia cordobensis]SAL66189.1 Flagellin N-methylase [Caballeronia cordobensis]